MGNVHGPDMSKVIEVIFVKHAFGNSLDLVEPADILAAIKMHSGGRIG